MENITSVHDLKIAIQNLENEHQLKGLMLKEQFNITYEHFKPVNLIKSTLSEVAESPYLITNIIGTATALVTGYITRKAVVGGSVNLFRKLLGGVIQFGVTNLIARHPDDIRKISSLIIRKIFPKKDEETTDNAY